MLLSLRQPVYPSVSFARWLHGMPTPNYRRRRDTLLFTSGCALRVGGQQHGELLRAGSRRLHRRRRRPVAHLRIPAVAVARRRARVTSRRSPGARRRRRTPVVGRRRVPRPLLRPAASAAAAVAHRRPLERALVQLLRTSAVQAIQVRDRIAAPTVAAFLGRVAL